MNILRFFTRLKETHFEPQRNVRFAVSARVEFETRRDIKKFRRAGAGHLSNPLQPTGVESDKYLAFNLLVDNERMIGRIFSERYQSSLVEGEWITMLVECRPRRNSASRVVHVSIPYTPALRPLNSKA